MLNLRIGIEEYLGKGKEVSKKQIGIAEKSRELNSRYWIVAIELATDQKKWIASVCCPTRSLLRRSKGTCYEINRRRGLYCAR